MEVFEIVIGLLLLGAALAAIARKFQAPYPALVALAGTGLAFIPGLPTISLDPELALTLFVAPVLVDSAFDASPRDLLANWRSILSLTIGAVALTIAAVAVAMHFLVPGIPWAAAIALGAIVAPPDAAAATTVLKQLRPPNRLLVILEGESLFNDASALIVYRLALGAAATGAVAGWMIVPTLIFVTVGSIVLGFALAKCILPLNAKIKDLPTAVIVQFGTTFAVWILAENLHLSGIITLVVYAMTASRRSPQIMAAKLRIPAWAVWEVMVFVLNVLAFVLIGFQLRLILERTDLEQGKHFALIAAIICGTVFASRILWVTLATTLRRKTNPDSVLDPKAAAVVGWCGMRGTITIATALALPADFPERDLILATALGVVLDTLVLQGFTLKSLLKWLDLKDDGLVEREVRHARVESLKASLVALEKTPNDEASQLVKQSFRLQLDQAQQEHANDSLPQVEAGEAGPKTEVESDAFRVATDALREKLAQLKTEKVIGDAAYQRIQEEFDWIELGWEQVLRKEAE